MKKASVCFIAAIVLLFAFVLTGCGEQNKPVSPTPDVSPTPSTAPSVLPEIKDEITPDNGIVQDEDGVITEGDTGTVGENAVDDIGNAVEGAVDSAENAARSRSAVKRGR